MQLRLGSLPWRGSRTLLADSTVLPGFQQGCLFSFSGQHISSLSCDPRDTEASPEADDEALRVAGHL